MYSKLQIDDLRDKRQYGIGRMLLLARKDFIGRLNEAMHERLEDLPSAGASVLPFLDLEGTRGVELARRMGVSKQAVARAIKELEIAGLIQKTPDEEDARAFRVQFSAKGLRYMMTMHEAIDRVENEYSEMLGAKNAKALRKALCQIAYQTDLP